jgi:hypothetical protein
LLELELELELELVPSDFGLDEFAPDVPRIATPPGAGAGRSSVLLLRPLTLDAEPDFEVGDEVRLLPTPKSELPPLDDDDEGGGEDGRSMEPAPPLEDPPELVDPPLDEEPELVVPVVRGTACAAASAGTAKPSATATVAIR